MPPCASLAGIVFDAREMRPRIGATVSLSRLAATPWTTHRDDGELVRLPDGALLLPARDRAAAHVAIALGPVGARVTREVRRLVPGAPPQ